MKNIVQSSQEMSMTAQLDCYGLGIVLFNCRRCYIHVYLFLLEIQFYICAENNS